MKIRSFVLVCLVALSVVSGLAATSLSYSEEDCPAPIIPTGNDGPHAMGNDGPHNVIPQGNDGPHNVIPTN